MSAAFNVFLVFKSCLPDRKYYLEKGAVARNGSVGGWKSGGYFVGRTPLTPKTFDSFFLNLEVRSGYSNWARWDTRSNRGKKSLLLGERTRNVRPLREGQLHGILEPRGNN